MAAARAAAKKASLKLSDVHASDGEDGEEFYQRANSDEEFQSDAASEEKSQDEAADEDFIEGDKPKAKGKKAAATKASAKKTVDSKKTEPGKATKIVKKAVSKEPTSVRDTSSGPVRRVGLSRRLAPNKPPSPVKIIKPTL